MSYPKKVKRHSTDTNEPSNRILKSEKRSNWELKVPNKHEVQKLDKRVVGAHPCLSSPRTLVCHWAVSLNKALFGAYLGSLPLASILPSPHDRRHQPMFALQLLRGKFSRLAPVFKGAVLLRHEGAASILQADPQRTPIENHMK